MAAPSPTSLGRPRHARWGGFGAEPPWAGLSAHTTVFATTRACCHQWPSASAASTSPFMRSRGWASSGTTWVPAPCRETPTTSPQPWGCCCWMLASTAWPPGTSRASSQVTVAPPGPQQPLRSLGSPPAPLSPLPAAGQYGIPKPWNFPFLKSYWLGEPSSARHPPYPTSPFAAPQGEPLPLATPELHG